MMITDTNRGIRSMRLIMEEVDVTFDQLEHARRLGCRICCAPSAASRSTNFLGDPLVSFFPRFLADRVTWVHQNACDRDVVVPGTNKFAHHAEESLRATRILRSTAPTVPYEEARLLLQIQRANLDARQ